MVLKFKKLSPDAKVPRYSHPDDAGFDICSLEEKTLQPGERYAFKTGLASEIPSGWYVQIFDRSGLAIKNGIKTMAGVIDSGYRGEWGIILVNLGSNPVTIQKGDRIAQGVLLQTTQAEIIEVQELSDSSRGEGGFGSTGER